MYIGLLGGGFSPDFTGVYNENGSLNLFGYDRIIPNSNDAFLEFEAGKIDILPLSYSGTEKRIQYENDPTKIVQNELARHFGFFGFNMLENRPPIGNRSPSIGDPDITTGLAIRKAICYTVDREKINEIVHDGEYEIIDWPIYARMGIWCNPNIIRYDHDLSLAIHYMELNGYSSTTNVICNSFIPIISIFIGTITLHITINKKRKQKRT